MVKLQQICEPWGGVSVLGPVSQVLQTGGIQTTEILSPRWGPEAEVRVLVEPHDI